MPHRVVHVLGAGDPTGHQFNGLSGERVLKPIGNEAGYVQIHPDRRLADRLQPGEGAVHAVRVAVGVSDHLDQREDMGRKQEMGAHHPSRVSTDRRQLAGGETGGVAGQDGRRRGDRVEFFEKRLLRRDILEDRFDHQVSAIDRRFKILCRNNPAHALGGALPGQEVVGSQFVDIGLCDLEGPLQRCGV